MVSRVSIKIKWETKNELKKLKLCERESYNDVIERLINSENNERFKNGTI